MLYFQDRSPLLECGVCLPIWLEKGWLCYCTTDNTFSCNVGNEIKDVCIRCLSPSSSFVERFVFAGDGDTYHMIICEVCGESQ